jgi:PAS domain S-box-containing protein
VLILEDNSTDAEIMLRALRQAGFDPEWKRVESEPDFLAALDTAPELILSDYSLPRFDGLNALRLLRERQLDIPFILISGTLGEEAAVSAIKLGADDYILKDRLARFEPAVKQALENKRLRNERKRAEARIADALNFNLVLFHSAPVGLIVYQADGPCLSANEAVAGILGVSRAELLQQNFRRLKSWQLSGLLAAADAALVGQAGRKLEVPLTSSAGKELWLSCDLVPFQYGSEAHLLLTLNDITERKANEHEIGRLNRLYAALSQVNQAIVRVKSREELFSEICRVIVEFGRFKLAWLGWLNPESREVTIEAQWGEVGEYLKNLRLYTNQPSDGLGPTSLCMLEGRTYVSNDFAADPNTLRWRESAAQHGLAASISVPIRRGGDFCGALMVYATEKNFFGKKEVALMEETAMDISFALDHLDLEQKRQQAESSLRESEERFRVVVEGTDVAMFLGVDLKFAYLNPAALKLFGADRPEQLLGQPVLERIHPDYHATVQDRVATITQGQRRVTPSREEIFLRLDGSPVPVEVTASPIIHQGRRGAVIFVQNITARKQAELALRKSRAIYFSLVTQLPIGIFRKDAEGRFVFVNPGFCKHKSLPFAAFLGRKPGELLSGKQTGSGDTGLIVKYAAEGEQHHLQIMQTGKTIEVDEEYLLANGQKLFLHVMKFPVFDSNGRVVGSQGIQVDITERKLAEAQVNLQLSALTAAANAIVITDRKGKIEWVNPAFSKITGYPAEEAIGNTPRLLKSGQHPPAFYAALWNTVLAGQVWHGELVNRRKDGKFYTEETIITPVRGAGGEIAHFVAIKMDVTERRQLEDRLQQSQKMEAIGMLAGGIAHDFNNILAAMFGFAYLLMEDTKDNPPARENVMEILKSANRAKDLVQQILTFSRKREQNRQVIKLDTTVKEALKFLRASLPAQIKIQMQLAEDAPAVLADPTQIYQVAVNLGTNALHAMENRSGQLTVKLEAFLPDETFLQANRDFRPVQYAKLTIADTGHGMDATTLGRIFEPFFTTKPVGKGTGLGLAVVHGIVQSHEGLIQVESRGGEGTTFCLYFPSRTTGAMPVEKAGSEVPKGQGQKLLLLDDEPTLTMAIKRLLVRMNYQVTATNSAREAIDLCRVNAEKFDLVITDLTMPEMNGLEVTRQIRAFSPNLRIILVSGLIATLSRDNLLAEGICEVVEKPISPLALAEVIQRVLAAPWPAPGLPD